MGFIRALILDEDGNQLGQVVDLPAAAFECARTNKLTLIWLSS